MQVTVDPRGLKLIAIRFANALGKPFGIDPFPRAFPNEETASLRSRETVFDRIYSSNYWASSESRSGVGSEQSFSSAYRKRLKKLLSAYQLRSVFDAPCGDLNWIATLARDPEIAFQGGDISARVIESCKTEYPDIPVRLFDICEDAFPLGDVWHCRDCLFHLPFTDIRRALENFTRSRIPFALLTTHRARVHRNLDVGAGGFRYLDLERSPVSLPPPILYLKDFRPGLDFPRYVGLWRRDAIEGALRNWND